MPHISLNALLRYCGSNLPAPLSGGHGRRSHGLCVGLLLRKRIPEAKSTIIVNRTHPAESL